MRAHGLDLGLLTVGKAIGGGVPAATYGFGKAVAARVEAASGDALLDRLIHLSMPNRSVLLTPSHNMALMSHVTSEAGRRHREP
jgi:glutamate-1-semialdehyde aminotransferase